MNDEAKVSKKADKKNGWLINRANRSFHSDMGE